MEMLVARMKDNSKWDVRAYWRWFEDGLKEKWFKFHLDDEILWLDCVEN